MATMVDKRRRAEGDNFGLFTPRSHVHSLTPTLFDADSAQTSQQGLPRSQARFFVPTGQIV